MSPDGITLAHGIGGAKDLPISPELAIAGATAALVISFTVLAVAWRNPRYDAATSGRPAPAQRRRRGRLDLVAGPLAGPRLRAVPLRRRGRDLRQGPGHQPGLRRLLRLVVGGPGPALAALRSGLEGDQPGPHHQPRLREDLRQRPRARGLHLPRAARPLAGRPRALRLRLARAGLPLLHRARSGPAVVCGVRRRDAGRRRPLRQHLLRAGRPVRGLLHPRLADVDLGPPRRGAADPQPARQPRRHPGARRPGRRGRGALRQHGVRLVQGLRPLGEVRPEPRGPVRLRLEQPGAAGLLRLRGRRSSPPAPCSPVWATT